MPRFIPKTLYQAIALFLLVVCLALTIYWAIADAGLYHWLRENLGRTHKGIAVFSTFLALFACWLIVVLPIRRLSTMPTLAEEVGSPVDSLSSLGSGLRRLYARAEAKNEEMYRTRGPYPPEMKRRARVIGLGFALVGLGFGVAAVLSLVVSLADGNLYVIQIVLLILSPAFVIAGVYQIIAGRSVIRK